jgi:hypothetical protein
VPAEPVPLPPAPAHDARWEDTPHRPGDAPLRRVPPELAPNTPAGRAARSLGRQLRAWRTAQGLTQRRVADRLGWDQPQVARLEGGSVHPNLATLTLLAERLGLRITLGGETGDVAIADATPEAI